MGLRNFLARFRKPHDQYGVQPEAIVRTVDREKQIEDLNEEILRKKRSDAAKKAAATRKANAQAKA